MAIKLSQLRQAERTITVEWEGDQVDFAYRPRLYTPELEDDMQASVEQNRPAVSMAEGVSQLVIWWDVLDEQGERLPTDFETVRHFPAEFLTAVINAISADQQAGAEDRKNSGGGSPRKAR